MNKKEWAVITLAFAIIFGGAYPLGKKLEEMVYEDPKERPTWVSEHEYLKNLAKIYGIDNANSATSCLRVYPLDKKRGTVLRCEVKLCEQIQESNGVRIECDEQEKNKDHAESGS